MDFKRLLVLLVFFVFVVLTASRIVNAQTQAPHPDERAQVIKLLKCIENDQYGSFCRGRIRLFQIKNI